MKLALPVLLSVNGGYVDTARFLALQGLFCSHVTGNVATLAAALVLGTYGVVNKLLALPVFAVTVLLVRLLSDALSARQLPDLRILVILELTLLVAAAILAIWLGPFPNGDAPRALLTGMTLVCAMAVQNAMQRIDLAYAPPTTIMTSTSTQLMIDLADLLLGTPMAAAARGRIIHALGNIGGFFLGGATAAALFYLTGVWCFAMPPCLVLASLLLPAEQA